MALGVPFWTDESEAPIEPEYTHAADAWSKVAYGPNRLWMPGLARIEWVKHPKKNIDKSKKPSTVGATPIFLGIEIAEWAIRLRISSASQLQALQVVLREIYPRTAPSSVTQGGTKGYQGAGQAPGHFVGLDFASDQGGQVSTYSSNPNDPVLIYHPGLALVGITKAVIEGFTPPTPKGDNGDDKQMWDCRFHCIEYRKAVATKAKRMKATAPPVVPEVKPNNNSLTSAPPSATDTNPYLEWLLKPSGT